MNDELKAVLCGGNTRPTCPDCGNYIYLEHRCGVPILTEAIGCELSERESRFIQWAAGHLDFDSIDTLAGLFRKTGQRCSTPLRRPPGFGQPITDGDDSDEDGVRNGLFLSGELLTPGTPIEVLAGEQWIAGRFEWNGRRDDPAMLSVRGAGLMTIDSEALCRRIP